MIYQSLSMVMLEKKTFSVLYSHLNSNEAASYPFLDHQAPPFHVLIDFCSDATVWLNQNPNHVVAIHCKAGKGRTGTVIAALLLHTGIAKDATEAMKLYGKERTHNMKVCGTFIACIEQV